MGEKLKKKLLRCEIFIGKSISKVFEFQIQLSFRKDNLARLEIYKIIEKNRNIPGFYKAIYFIS